MNKYSIAFIAFFLFVSGLLTGSYSLLEAQEAVIPLCNGYERKGSLCRLPVADSHPTQFSVGMILVQCKKNKLEKKDGIKMKDYLRKKKNHIPAVIGPYGKFYITDRHHLGHALSLAKTDEWIGKEQEVVLLIIRNDNQAEFTSEEFWQKMVATQNVYPYDQEGRLIDNFGLELSYMTLSDLKDNPYRTLSKWVREGCGYIKKLEKKCVALKATVTPASSPAFMEMYWARYLQTQLPEKGNLDSEQLWELYPQALSAVLDKKKTGDFFLNLGLDPKEYGQNQTGSHLKLRFLNGGCVKRSKEQIENQ